jgi:hypothetical protein
VNIHCHVSPRKNDVRDRIAKAISLSIMPLLLHARHARSAMLLSLPRVAR